MFEQIVRYVGESLPYYLVVCVVLFLWDLVDFYVELREISFLRTFTFGVYYVVRAFFSISVMEINNALSLLSFSNRFVIAFVTPIVFTTVLQNLVVEIAGKEQVNIKELFGRFRTVAISGLAKHFDAAQVKLRIQLLNSKINTSALREECQFIVGPDEFADLEKQLEDKPDREKRSAYIILITYRSPDRAKHLVKEREQRAGSSSIM